MINEQHPALSNILDILDIRNQVLNIDYLLTSEELGQIAQLFIESLNEVQDCRFLIEHISVRKIYDDLNVICYGALFYWGLCNGNFELK